MNNQNQENLRELFEKFLDAKQAQKYVEDVQKAEEILRENPAPEPDDMLIANIKAEIAKRLPARKTYVFKHIAYKVVSVAAAVIILDVSRICTLEIELYRPQSPLPQKRKKPRLNFKKTLVFYLSI